MFDLVKRQLRTRFCCIRWCFIKDNCRGSPILWQLLIYRLMHQFIQKAAPVEKPAYAGTIKKISCPLVFLSRCLIWLRDNKGQDNLALDSVLLRTIAAGAPSCGNCCFVALCINLFKKLHLRCRKACLRRNY